MPNAFYRKGYQFHKTKAKAFYRKEPQFHKTKADLTLRHATELNKSTGQSDVILTCLQIWTNLIYGPKRPFWGPWRSSAGRRGPDLVPTLPDWLVCVGLMVITHFNLVLGPFWTPGALKGPVLAQMPLLETEEVLRGPWGIRYGLNSTAPDWLAWV